MVVLVCDREVARERCVANQCPHRHLLSRDEGVGGQEACSRGTRIALQAARVSAAARAHDGHVVNLARGGAEKADLVCSEASRVPASGEIVTAVACAAAAVRSRAITAPPIVARLDARRSVAQRDVRLSGFMLALNSSLDEAFPPWGVSLLRALSGIFSETLRELGGPTRDFVFARERGSRTHVR